MAIRDARIASAFAVASSPAKAVIHGIRNARIASAFAVASSPAKAGIHGYCNARIASAFCRCVIPRESGDPWIFVTPESRAPLPLRHPRESGDPWTLSSSSPRRRGSSDFGAFGKARLRCRGRVTCFSRPKEQVTNKNCLLDKSLRRPERFSGYLRIRPPCRIRIAPSNARGLPVPPGLECAHAFPKSQAETKSLDSRLRGNDEQKTPPS